jgi:hypothetical protein
LWSQASLGKKEYLNNLKAKKKKKKKEEKRLEEWLKWQNMLALASSRP